MPSSLVCCSEDSSFELKQLHTYAQGKHANERKDNFFDCALSFRVCRRSLEFASAPVVSLSTDFSSTEAAFGSWVNDIDSPPSLEHFLWEHFPSSGILTYFFDLNTPESAGSAAAHQIYRPNTDVIWKPNRFSELFHNRTKWKNTFYKKSTMIKNGQNEVTQFIFQILEFIISTSPVFPPQSS